MTTLNKARKILENHTLAIVCGDTAQTYNERGIKTLLSILSDNPALLCGASVADKVVGKAAALLMVKGKVKEVYAEVISESATDIFRKYRIPFAYGTIADKIINRSGTGMCPMEQTVVGIDNPDDAFVALKQKQILMIKSEV